MQCPIIAEMLELFQQDHMDDVQCIDITHREDIAVEKQIYYPFLTIFNETLFWYGPVTADVLDGVRSNRITREEPFLLSQSQAVVKGDLIPLSSSTMRLVQQGCTMCGDCGQTKRKAEFLSSCGLDHFGFVHQLNGKTVGGVEWMPSLQVPYPIPKDKDTAFLTCVYHSSDTADFKSWPLLRLEERLRQTYQRILVISDEESTFPNGNKRWFEGHGYIDMGRIQVLDGYACLHLMEKKLS